VSGRPLQIAVIGAGRCGEETVLLAEEIGRLLATRECLVVCGGLGGVMEAVAKGASEAGGVSVGILPGTDVAEANRWVSHAVATGIGEARNLAVVASSQAAIAVGGEWGTASEVALARKLGRPVVVLGEPRVSIDGDGIHHVATPVQAVELALRLAGGG
jgi:uncharacterized protein (TIGR00725 family)